MCKDEDHSAADPGLHVEGQTEWLRVPRWGWGHHRPQQLFLGAEKATQRRFQLPHSSNSKPGNCLLLAVPSHNWAHLKPVLPLLRSSLLSSSHLLPAHSSSQAKGGQTGTHGVSSSPGRTRQGDAEPQTQQHRPGPKFHAHQQPSVQTPNEQEGMEPRCLATLIKSLCSFYFFGEAE